MILCCGETLIDFVTLPGVRAYGPYPGGSVFNIAVGLGRLEAPVAYLQQEGLLYQREKLRELTAEQLEACLAYTGRAAAINCSRQGANPPYKHEMEKLDG